MAGSWNHMVVKAGPEYMDLRTRGKAVGAPFRDSNGSFPMVENMGDAVEAMEECYGMVWQLARQLAVARGWDPSDSRFRQTVLGIVEDAQQNYKQGYEAGAGEQARW